MFSKACIYCNMIQSHVVWCDGPEASTSVSMACSHWYKFDSRRCHITSIRNTLEWSTHRNHAHLIGPLKCSEKLNCLWITWLLVRLRTNQFHPSYCVSIQQAKPQPHSINVEGFVHFLIHRESKPITTNQRCGSAAGLAQTEINKINYIYEGFYIPIRIKNKVGYSIKQCGWTPSLFSSAVANSIAVSDSKQARHLGRASYILSGTGVIVTIVTIAIIVGVVVGGTSSAVSSSSSGGTGSSTCYYYYQNGVCYHYRSYVYSSYYCSSSYYSSYYYNYSNGYCYYNY